MIVLVTGATGFVAGHLIPLLVAQGHHVVALGHDAARLERLPQAEHLILDLRDPGIGNALPARVDAVIHLAQANIGFPEGASDLFEVNVSSTQRLLEHARRAGVRRFVYASTGTVYGGGDRPWKEIDRTDGNGYYAATRQAAERLVQAYTGFVPCTILRLFAPYGPGQRGRMVPGLIDRVRAGQPVTLREGGRPCFNPLYISHVADVFAQALSLEGDHTVNVAGDEVLSIRDMAEIIGCVVGREPVFEEVTGDSGGDFVADTTLMRRTFRLPERLISFEQGVTRLLDAQSSVLSPQHSSEAGGGR
jgi:nucleoside-diphosphate-sugar epimerase